MRTKLLAKLAAKDKVGFGAAAPCGHDAGWDEVKGLRFGVWVGARGLKVYIRLKGCHDAPRQLVL